jgi:hypothetical protein
MGPKSANLLGIPEGSSYVRRSKKMLVDRLVLQHLRYLLVSTEFMRRHIFQQLNGKIVAGGRSMDYRFVKET